MFGEDFQLSYASTHTKTSWYLNTGPVWKFRGLAAVRRS